MTRIAITGHRGLPVRTEQLVTAAIATELHAYQHDHLVGLTCLADGADQIFARAALAAGGELHVIVSAAQYRAGLPADFHQEYDALLARANRIHQLDYTESNEQAHMAASEHMLDHAEQLFAVWDGEPARGHGETADVVTHARNIGLPVTIIWPEGCTRD